MSFNRKGLYRAEGAAKQSAPLLCPRSLPAACTGRLQAEQVVFLHINTDLDAVQELGTGKRGRWPGDAGVPANMRARKPTATAPWLRLTMALGFTAQNLGNKWMCVQ